MRYYIIAGEASGDLHASNLMKEMKAQNAQSTFRCWGGDLMEAQGGVLVKHYRDLAFMGFIEVIANIRIIVKNLKFCKQDIIDYKPDALILVDYPGFNLRIAEFAKVHNIKVIYYISPQVWAWKRSRVHKIKKTVDRMITILPFEKDFYKAYNYEVDFVGHPLLDVIKDLNPPDPKLFRKECQLDDRPIIALLPGSRKQEISKMLNRMLQLEPLFKDYQFVIAGAPGIDKDFYVSTMGAQKVRVIHAKTYEILQLSEVALVTSGTATLETALFGVPEVVCFKANALSVIIARFLIKIKFISLVNLIMDRLVVTELIQQDFSVNKLQTELQNILPQSLARKKMLADYKELRTKLGGVGASAKAAKIILSEI